ncbi:MAG: class I SAM-dependent methyltransferase [Bacteroidota bacterium]
MPEASAHTAAFWDARYAADGYTYGTEPNAWLARHADLLPPTGRALVPASGEGRDAVWLASRGLSVTAVDLSREGLAKTHRLAEARGVTVQTVHADLLEWTWPEATEAAVVLSFAHLGPESRREVHRRSLAALRPGGLVVLEAFHVSQLPLREQSGGPPREELLFTADLLREDFAEAEIVSLAEAETTLREGPGHDGPARVVHGVFRRR